MYACEGGRLREEGTGVYQRDLKEGSEDEWGRERTAGHTS